MTVYTGSCHCGGLAIEYKTALQPVYWPLRECQCSFCRKHAMLSTSDPNGDTAVPNGARALIELMEKVQSSASFHARRARASRHLAFTATLTQSFA